MNPVDVTGARNGRRGLPGLVLWLTVAALSVVVIPESMPDRMRIRSACRAGRGV